MSDKKALEDDRMVMRLYDIAQAIGDKETPYAEDLKNIAARLKELTSKAALRRHWCDGNE